MFLALTALVSTPAARAQGYTDTLLTSLNQNTDFPCGNGASTTTQNIIQSIAAAAHFGGGTVDLTCYQGAITITSDIFSTVSKPILLYLPEHAVTVNANATIPSNFEICGGPGSSIAAGMGFTLTNHAAACFNGFTGGAGGSPGGANGTVQYNHAGVLGGILNSSVDPSTGDLTLGAGLTVNSTDGIYLFSTNASTDFGVFLLAGGGAGITIDATGAGAGGIGPVTVSSAGGISLADNSDTSIDILEGTNVINLDADSDGGGILFDVGNAGGIVIDATGHSFFSDTGTGPVVISAKNTSGPGVYLQEGANSGITLDATGNFVGGLGTGPITFMGAGDLDATLGGNINFNTSSPGDAGVAILLNASVAGVDVLAAQTILIESSTSGGVNFKGGPGGLRINESFTFATLPAIPALGMFGVVTDSNTNTWGASVAGGGADTVLVWYNGTNWTVYGK